MATLVAQRHSRTIYEADGVTTSWNFTFSGGYLDRAHVKASVTTGGVTTQLTVTPSDFVGEYQLSIVPAVAAGSLLTIYRDTPKVLPLVDFTEGSGLTELALDTNAKQAVFIAAESADAIGTVDVSQAVAAAESANASASSAAANAALVEAALGTISSTVTTVRYSGGGSVFTLPVSVLSNALVDVYIEGVYQQKNSFTAVGTTLTLGEVAPAGVNNIEVKITAVTVVVGEPGATGPQGPPGPQGPQGIPGPAGAGSGDMLRATYDVAGNGIVDAAESVPWSGITDKPAVFPPDTHTHGAAAISDSTVVGRGVLTAADAAAARTAIGAGVGDVTLAGAQAVSNKTTYTFGAQYDAGSSGASKTLAFSSGQKQLLTLTANATITLTFPGVGNYQVVLKQDATGSRTVTWSGVSLWVGSATAPAINTAANGYTLVSIFWDGTNAWLGAAKVNA